MGDPMRRRYIYRVMRQQGEEWVAVRHYQSRTAALKRADSLATWEPGVRFRIQRSLPVEFEQHPVIVTEVHYVEGVAS